MSLEAQSENCSKKCELYFSFQSVLQTAFSHEVNIVLRNRSQWQKVRLTEFYLNVHGSQTVAKKQSVTKEAYKHYLDVCEVFQTMNIGNLKKKTRSYLILADNTWCSCLLFQMGIKNAYIQWQVKVSQYYKYTLRN